MIENTHPLVAVDYAAVEARALAYSATMMSSLEIAERTGKEHRNVMRDIREQLGEVLGEGGLLKFERSYTNAQNKVQPCYHLPKRETLILVSGYSVTLRAAIVDRWAELEAALKPALPDFSNPVAAARAWADAKEGELAAIAQAKEATAEVARLAPRAQVADRVVAAKRSLRGVASRLPGVNLSALPV